MRDFNQFYALIPYVNQIQNNISENRAFLVKTMGMCEKTHRAALTLSLHLDCIYGITHYIRAGRGRARLQRQILCLRRCLLCTLTRLPCH